MADSQMKSTWWLRALLVGSLALNLVVVGVVVGVLVKHGHPSGGPRFDLTVGPLTRAMEEPQRDGVRAALRDRGVFRAMDRSAMRTDQQDLIATLRADPFDDAAFRAILSRQRVRLAAGQETVADVVSDQIARMSAPQRAAFADRLGAQLRRSASAGDDRQPRSGGR